MTKKDYELIAKAIEGAGVALRYASVNTGETRRALQIVTLQLSSALAIENPRFDKDKFYNACKVDN